MNEVTKVLSQDGDAVVSYLPRLAGALIIFAVGYVIARLLGRVVAFLLSELGADRLGESTGLADTLKRAGLPTSTSRILGQLTFVIVLVAALVQTVDALALAPLSQSLRQLLEFAPHVVLAMLVLLGGAALAEVLGRATTSAVSRANVVYHALLGTVVRVLILVMALLLALQQLTLDATFLLSILLVILGGVALTAAIAFGWGARSLVENLAAARYAEQNFAVGDAVEVEGARGTIERIGPTGVTLRAANGGKAVIPNAVLARTVVRPGPAPEAPREA